MIYHLLDSDKANDRHCQEDFVVKRRFDKVLIIQTLETKNCTHRRSEVKVNKCLSAVWIKVSEV
ncbi:uncharacterized protein PRCAT00006367001 [Priceomyces carsonii]|uniref:uncharacterized protein n=1 Tax=Priceomyces carsonii TaxID=28549 RepID=UPI002ED8FDEC|nr:unnamed protein product [Priceomyces carsonii]